jgi:hypothetical protein
MSARSDLAHKIAEIILGGAGDLSSREIGMEYKVDMVLHIATSVDTHDVWEIRGIVDGMIVYRVKHGRRYAYHVDHPDTLDLYRLAGRLTVAKEVQ